jgi:hypothetical protein
MDVKSLGEESQDVGDSTRHVKSERAPSWTIEVQGMLHAEMYPKWAAGTAGLGRQRETSSYWIPYKHSLKVVSD